MPHTHIEKCLDEYGEFVILGLVSLVFEAEIAAIYAKGLGQLTNAKS